MQKSGPFHLKYMECGSIHLCKYSWYYMRNGFESSQQRTSLVMCQEILRAASKLHSKE